MLKKISILVTKSLSCMVTKRLNFDNKLKE